MKQANTAFSSPKSDHIRALLEQCTGVAVKTADVRPGNLFFALQIRRPRKKGRLLIWRLWTLLEMHAYPLLRLLTRLAQQLSGAGTEIDRLLGHEYDGNAYAQRALKLGARFAVVSSPWAARDPRCILVADVAAVLKDLAAHHRAQFEGQVIAITGSAGKSTTTKLTHELLNTRFRAHLSQQFNGGDAFYAAVLGVPLDAEVAVFEVATVSAGMLADFCQVLRPTHGLVTHVGLAHLDTFFRLENIQKAKWELYEYLLANQGHTYLNTNHPWLTAQRARLPRTWLYGSGPENRTRGESLPGGPHLRVRLSAGIDPCIDIQTRLAGRFNLDNILAAAAVARSFAVPWEEIQRILEIFLPPENRSEVFEWGSNRVYNDNFHNTLIGLKAALNSFMDFEARHRLLVIGDVPDLGAASDDRHRELLGWIHSLGADEVLFVGPRFYRVRDRPFGRFFRKPEVFFRWLAAHPPEDTFIFVKGFTRLRLLEPFRPAGQD